MRKSELNTALSRPRLSYGVSPKALGICWGPTAVLSVLIGSSAGWLWAAIPCAVGATIHLVLRWMYRKEPKIFDMYGRYSQLHARYHPHPREKLSPPFERPYRIGRGLRF